MTGRPRATVLLGFSATVVLIGLNFVAVRMSNQELAPTWGGGSRFAAAALLMAWVVVLRRIPMPRGRALLGAMLYGTLFFAVFFGFAYWALEGMASSTAAVINSTMPLLAFLTAVLVGQERFGWNAIIGSMVVIAGIVILVGTDAASLASPARIVAMFIATIGAAVGSVVVKGFPRSHPLATNTVAMATAGALLLAASAIRGEPWTLPVTPTIWVVAVYLVLNSLLLFPLVVWVIGEWTASASTYAVVLSPIITVPVAALLLAETIRWTFALAAAVIIAGVYVGALRGPKRPDPLPPTVT